MFLGSRGFGHQVATDALVAMEKAMKRDAIETNDRQLACARIASQEGQDYLKAMSAAANFAWVNRSSMTFLCRQVGIILETSFLLYLEELEDIEDDEIVLGPYFEVDSVRGLKRSGLGVSHGCPGRL